MNISFVFTRPSWDQPAIRAVVAEGLGLGLTAMHRQRMGIKFTDAGKNVYKIPERTLQYNHDKQKRVGHNRPLVFTGKMRGEVMRSIVVRPLKSRASASGTMSARVFNLSRAIGARVVTNRKTGVRTKVRNKKANPDYRGEIETLVQKDDQMIADVMRDWVTKFFDTKGKQKTTRI